MSTNKWHQKAVEFTKLGRLNVALHCWSRALDEDPDDPEAWVSKGVTLEKLGKHQEAIDCYTEAININPCFATAWYNKGAVLGNFGNYREALGCFMEAVRQGHPKAEAAVEACRNQLGDTVWEQKKPNPVVEKYKSGTEINDALRASTRKKRRRLW